MWILENIFLQGIKSKNRERKWRISLYLSDCLPVSHEPRFVHVCEIHVSLNPWCDFKSDSIVRVLNVDWLAPIFTQY